MRIPSYHPPASARKRPPPPPLLAPSNHPTHHPTVTHLPGPGKPCSDQGGWVTTGTLQPSRPRRLACFPSPEKSRVCLLAANRTGVRLPEFAGGL